MKRRLGSCDRPSPHLLTYQWHRSANTSHIGKKRLFGGTIKKKKKTLPFAQWKLYSNLKPQSNPASCLDLRPPRRLRLGGEEPSEPGARHFPRTFSHWQLRLPSIPRCRPRGAWPRHWSLRTSRSPPLTFWPLTPPEEITKESQKISWGLSTVQTIHLI